jgi:hypothetical protein
MEWFSLDDLPFPVRGLQANPRRHWRSPYPGSFDWFGVCANYTAEIAIWLAMVLTGSSQIM